MSTDRRDTIDAAPPRASLRGLIQRALRKRDLDLRVAAPATVVSYTPATQTAMCTIGFLRVTATDTPAGEVAVPMPPELVSARVAVAQGTTWSDQPPIPVAGDTGLLIFADRALDQWYRGAGLPVDPALGRTHDQADAIFFPGLSPDARLSTPALNPLGRTIDAPQIVLGAAAVPGTDNVAIASLLHAYLVAAVTAAPVVALDGGASFKAALLAYLGANPFTAYAASKVSAE
jgi:hypothetical protein